MFIDANIFLEIFLKDKNCEKCKNFIKDMLKKKIPIYTSDFIVYSCILIIYRKLKSCAQIRNFLIFVNSINITIIRPSIKAMYSAADYMKRYSLDFDDALVISCMGENGIKTLVTYDKHFNKDKKIKIIQP